MSMEDRATKMTQEVRKATDASFEEFWENTTPMLIRIGFCPEHLKTMRDYMHLAYDAGACAGGIATLDQLRNAAYLKRNESAQGSN